MTYKTLEILSQINHIIVFLDNIFDIIIVLNIGKVILRIIEIQRGKYLEEDDIIRLDRPDGY